jgi:hypothetical protein
MPVNLDQFYTNSTVAAECIRELEGLMGPIDGWPSILEPSAGSGSFLTILPEHAIGVDLDPRHPWILKVDYLEWDVPTLPSPCLVIGNPPFGKNSSLAIEFFNKSAAFADTIAFILPRTFRKGSVIDRLDRNFHLVHERILPIDSFHTPDGVARSVTTCFQVWKRGDAIRKPLSRGPSTHPDWDWLKTSIGATHAIRRVGASAGKMIPLTSAAPASHFFIKSNVDDLDVRWDKLWNECWREEKALNAKWDVAGNPSLTKDEIVHYYSSLA